MFNIMDLLNNKITLNKSTYPLNPKKIKNIFNQINNDTSKVVSVSRIYLNTTFLNSITVLIEKN